MEWRKGLSGTLLMVILMIGLCSAEVKDPNLSPFEQWRSAYDCLQNTSNRCSKKYQLTPVGWVNVTYEDTKEYCTQGCAAHTWDLLSCLDDVMDYYKFQDGYTVRDINNTITVGCKSGFNGNAIAYSSARLVQSSMTTTYVSALAAWLFIAYMNV